MVVCIILYDHIDPQGAFNKQSPINVSYYYIISMSDSDILIILLI